MNSKFKESYCCEMKGLLSFLILFLLSTKPMSGTEMCSEIEKRKGVRPSPGTIYPALRTMKKSGLVKEKKLGNSIIYSLTKLGKRNLKIARRNFLRAFKGII